MKFTLFYTERGKIQSTVYREETVEVENSREAIADTLRRVLALMREAYKYDCRIDNGEKSWFIRRTPQDKAEGLFWVVYRPRWNERDEFRMTRKELTEVIMKEAEC